MLSTNPISLISIFQYSLLSIYRHDRGFSIKTIDRPGHHHHQSSPLTGIETIDSSLTQDPACASLLPKSEADERFNNNLFGQFKGFSLTPLNQATSNKTVEPTKSAPPPPTVPTVMIKTNFKSQQRSNALRSAFMSQPPVLCHPNDNNQAPNLPPLNPGSTARPLISSPVLAATTCTSMELIKAAVPTRPAPEVPVRPPETLSASSTSLATQKSSRPNSTTLNNFILDLDKPDKKQATTLNRIASILKPGNSSNRGNSIIKDERTNSLPRSQHQKANKVIDKEILRNLEISNPIPQKEIEISSPVIPVIVPVIGENDRKTVVMRAQSMRDCKLAARPAIHTFGSMRQPNSYKRPSSIPANCRPTSPPPPVPPSFGEKTEKLSDDLKIPGLPGYQNPPAKIPVNAKKIVEDAYDDCMNLVGDVSLSKIAEELSPSNDNIYAVIEDAIPMSVGGGKNLNLRTNEYKVPKKIDLTTDSSSENLGLLSEIVSEISSRNFDSIYSTSTLARKKKEKQTADKSFEILGSNSSLGTYVNSSHYKSPGSIYSNSASKFNSAVSETSSGYLLPSAVNVPQLHKKPKDIAKPIITTQKNIDETKLDSLKSTNPNINDAMSKALGIKPPGSPIKTTKFTPIKSINTTKKDDSIKPTKPPLSRTKTPPSLSKINSKNNDIIKTTRQGSDTSLKSPKTPEAQSTSRQGSDTSLKSNKSSGSKSVKDLNTTTPKTSNSGVKSKNNSPDLVSSCSTSSSNTSESPDVLGNGGKFKNIQKTPTLPRGKNSTMPPRPSNIVTKAATFAERKKSPVTSPKVVAKPVIASKNLGLIKNDIRQPLQKAAGSKSNVASLQQKFEQNKTSIGGNEVVTTSKNTNSTDIKNNGSSKKKI